MQNKVIRNLTPDEIIDEINFDDYLPQSNEKYITELTDIKNKAKNAIRKMIEEPLSYREHVEYARSFLEVLWRKYDCDNIVAVFEAYSKIEPILSDIERKKWYRDHTVHTFHVFIIGLRIISEIIRKIGDDEAKKYLKVSDEHINQYIPEFRDYNYKQRLFYLWSLISTFHDIAIPLENLSIIKDGLNEFTKKFNLNFSIDGPTFIKEIFCENTDAYFDVISRIFQGKVSPSDDGICYKQDEEAPYVRGIFEYQFNQNNHGLLSGFLMYKSIEKNFLLGHSKHKFTDPKIYDSYTKFILKQDIARAALAISLHNLKGSRKPLFMPISFSEHPLAFILILSDGIQEYLRLEGNSHLEGTKMCNLPDITLAISKSNIELEVIYNISEKDIDNMFFLNQARSYAEINKKPIPKSINDAAYMLCDMIKEDLLQQIILDDTFRLSLIVKKDNDEIFKCKC